MSKANVEVHMKHLKILVKWTISLNFEIYFLNFLWEIVFGVTSGKYLYL